jgi:hypothetical protein
MRSFGSLPLASSLAAPMCYPSRMTALLERAFAELAKLPLPEQDSIAQDLLDRIAADARWEALLSDPRSDSALDRLLAEADADIAAGRVMDFDPSNRPRQR